MNDFKTLKFEGIGTHWWIDLPQDISDKLAKQIEIRLLEVLNDFDLKYSRFKENTLISKLNNEKVLKDFPKELYEMLYISERVKDLTNGAFNVCVGTHLENLGYDADYSFKSSGKVNSSELRIVTLREDLIEITPPTRVDLGGIGKGWLIQKFVDELKEYNLIKFVVNGGGDVYVFDKDNKKYEFALENPFDNSEMIGKIKITNEAIACSSPTRRSWKDKESGKLSHHLIDFNSGESSNHILAVFTQGNSIVNCDLASTAIFVSELKKADEIAKKLEVEYLLIFPEGKFVKSTNYKGILN